MLTLALDTTATTASAALLDGERVISVFTQTSTLTHSQTLLPMIKALIETALYKPSDIEAFACSAGPGSFTGVRIGVATVKGLAFGTSKPCVGVSTLHALALNLAGLENAIACPCMDARRGQFYNALFSLENGDAVRLCPDRAISGEELSAELKALDRPVYFCGDGYLKALGLGYEKTLVTPATLILQNAASVGVAAARCFAASEDKSSFTAEALAPIYLRPSQAERLA